MRSELFTNCVDLAGSACKPFDGKKYYVSTGAVDTDHIDDDSLEIVDFSGKPSRANLEVDPGDVLFAKMQGTKKTLLIDTELSKHIYSTGFCAVRAKEYILNRRCLYHLVTSEGFLLQKDRNCSGATQKAITNVGLKKIIINVPSIEKQNAIADQLDCISRIIAKRQKELDTLDDLIKARFIELFGDPVNNSKCFPKEELGKVCIKITDGTHDTPERYSEGYLLITGKNIRASGIIYDDVEYVSEEDHKVIYARCNPEYEDVLYTNIGVNYGTACLNDLQYEFSMKNVALLKPDRSRMNGYYLWICLNLMRNYILLMNQVGGAQTFMGLATIKKIVIPIPPIEIQNSFIDFIKQVDKSKVAIKEALDKEQLLFDSLMQKYFV